ncbi:MAG: hypothetical protein RJB39_707 [Candidatus Parcubacteria bacterium]|jgi:hypothetical protein
MTISKFYFLEGPLKATPETDRGEMIGLLGPVQERGLVINPHEDKCFYPYAALTTTDEERVKNLTVLCTHYIPAYIEAGGLVFVVGRTTLEVWNGSSSEISVSHSTGRGRRESSRAQLFFEVTDLSIDQMSAVVSALNVKGLHRERLGEALVYHRA